MGERERKTELRIWKGQRDRDRLNSKTFLIVILKDSGILSIWSLIEREESRGWERRVRQAMGGQNS